MILANGDKCEGFWDNDKLQDKGIYTKANGEIYKGNWAENIKHGKGIEISSNED